MSVNDGVGILIGFAVVAGVVLGEIRWRKIKNKPVEQPKRAKKPRVEDNSNSFEPDDIDKDVDESPDDSLICDIFN